MILLVDNYDSFTYNLVQYIGELGKRIEVFRNDKISLMQAIKLNPSHLVISPGPGEPKDAGISNELITNFADKIPVLGVCLGHQCIGLSFGAEIVSAERLMHGKISLIYHNGKGIYQDLKNPFEATRYHSLIVRDGDVPDDFDITSWTEPEKEIMGIRHRELCVEGLQFHPESFLTEVGYDLLRNFMKTTGGERQGIGGVA